jgi:hypothetical protein
MVAVLLDDSRLFRIDDKQFEFSDKDSIFSIDKPTPKNDHLAEKGICTCCATAFKSVKSVCYW